MKEKFSLCCKWLKIKKKNAKKNFEENEPSVAYLPS